MAQMDQENFEFPDEKETKGKPVDEADVKVTASADFDIEIEDDTPAEDRKSRKSLMTTT